jgi:hypothetical protein
MRAEHGMKGAIGPVAGRTLEPRHARRPYRRSSGGESPAFRTLVLDTELQNIFYFRKLFINIK